MVATNTKFFIISVVVITTLIFIFHALPLNEKIFEPAVVRKKWWGWPVLTVYYALAVTIGLGVSIVVTKKSRISY